MLLCGHRPHKENKRIHQKSGLATLILYKILGALNYNARETNFYITSALLGHYIELLHYMTYKQFQRHYIHFKHFEHLQNRL